MPRSYKLHSPTRKSSTSFESKATQHDWAKSRFTFSYIFLWLHAAGSETGWWFAFKTITTFHASEPRLATFRKLRPARQKLWMHPGTYTSFVVCELLKMMKIMNTLNYPRQLVLKFEFTHWSCWNISCAQKSFLPASSPFENLKLQWHHIATDSGNHAVYLESCDYEANSYRIWTWGTTVELTREILLGMETTQWFPQAPESPLAVEREHIIRWHRARFAARFKDQTTEVCYFVHGIDQEECNW